MNKARVKFLTSKPVKRINSKIKRINNVFDIMHDKKLVGMSLGRYVPSTHREDMGATGSESTPYFTLRKIFDGESFSEDDIFADVGCGKGRVLAYMAVEFGFKGKLRGIELNDEVAQIAKSWSEQFDNIEIISGDAFKQDLSDITVLYLHRPFETEFFKKFINKFESEINHPVRLYYWVDQQSGGYLRNRDGWTMEKRMVLFKNHGLPAFVVPQGFSKWIYTPNVKEDNNG